MSVEKLKQDIKTALDNGSNAVQKLNTKVDANVIRQVTANEIAEAVQVYLKTSLKTVIGGAVVIPQDGGVWLKTTMQKLIETI